MSLEARFLAVVDAVGADIKSLTAALANKLGASSFAEETPSGAVNGSNKIFTLAFAPSPLSSVFVIADNVAMIAGRGFTLGGANNRTITFDIAPRNFVQVFYRK